MSLLESVYFRSPLWVQSAMISVFGATWYVRRYGRQFRAKVQALRANERLSSSQFNALQLAALNRLLVHARRSSYYGPLVAEVFGDRPLELLEELARFPRLTKQQLRMQPTTLFTGKPPWGTKCFRSSGTTGTPTDIYFTRAFHQQGMAYFQARCRDWAQVGLRAKRAMFGVRKVCPFQQSQPPFWRSSPVEHLTYYSIYHLAPNNLTAYVDHLASWQPELVMGYPSALNLVARHAIETGRRLSVRAAITTSETVTAELRQTIEQGFGCQLFDQYGAVEGTHFAAQCEHGRYHLSPERGIVEILDRDDRPCPPGQEGRVVVTGLENTLQPLIRYELGDVAYWAENQDCPCGRQMPILGGIQGRYEDYCVTPDGRRMLRFDTVFKGLAAIVEAQVVQEAPDRFTINLVPTAEFNAADRERLRHNFRHHAGDVQLDIVIVDRIPRTASGKFRAVVNRMLKQPAVQHSQT